MSRVVDNERVKLLANALDRASTTVFSVGVATPTVTWLFNIQNIGDKLGPGGLVTFMALAFASAMGLHLLARNVLGDLQ